MGQEWGRAPGRGRFRGVAAALLVAGMGLAACSPIQEPWVDDPEQLADERNRAPEQDKALRERAQRVQGAY